MTTENNVFHLSGACSRVTCQRHRRCGRGSTGATDTERSVALAKCVCVSERKPGVFDRQRLHVCHHVITSCSHDTGVMLGQVAVTQNARDVVCCARVHDVTYRWRALAS